MYTKYYGLKEKPFTLSPNPAYLYQSAGHRTALDHLEYALQSEAAFVLLTGDIGTGKTTLIRHLLRELPDDVVAAVIFNTNVTAYQLLKLILREYEVVPDRDKAENLERLNERLVYLYGLGKKPMLIIDEAQNLATDALEEVRMLSNLQTDAEPLLQIVMVGQPELKQRIADPSLAQLAQRITVNYHLAPLGRDETGRYIAHRLASAGAQRTDIFAPDGVSAVHDLSDGVPRLINVICDATLLAGYADGLEHMDEATVRAAARDRDLAPLNGSCPPSGPAETAPLPQPAPQPTEPPETVLARAQSDSTDEINRRLDALHARMEALVSAMEARERVERMRNIPPPHPEPPPRLGILQRLKRWLLGG